MADVRKQFMQNLKVPPITSVKTDRVVSKVSSATQQASRTLITTGYNTSIRNKVVKIFRAFLRHYGLHNPMLRKPAKTNTNVALGAGFTIVWKRGIQRGDITVDLVLRKLAESVLTEPDSNIVDTLSQKRLTDPEQHGKRFTGSLYDIIYSFGIAHFMFVEFATRYDGEIFQALLSKVIWLTPRYIPKALQPVYGAHNANVGWMMGELKAMIVNGIIPTGVDFVERWYLVESPDPVKYFNISSGTSRGPCCHNLINHRDGIAWYKPNIDSKSGSKFYMVLDRSHSYVQTLSVACPTWKRDHESLSETDVDKLVQEDIVAGLDKLLCFHRARGFPPQEARIRNASALGAKLPQDFLMNFVDYGEHDSVLQGCASHAKKPNLEDLEPLFSAIFPPVSHSSVRREPTASSEPSTSTSQSSSTNKEEVVVTATLLTIAEVAALEAEIK